jgi:hypothetical protein
MATHIHGRSVPSPCPVAAPITSVDRQTGGVPKCPLTGAVRVYDDRAEMTRFADIDLAAIRLRRHGRDRQLTYSYALRAHDDGRGHVERATVRTARVALGLSPRTSQRILAAGMSIFWEPDGRGGLYLRAPARIAVALGVRSFRAAAVCTLQDLRGQIATVRARLVLQSIAAIAKGRPISNAAIASLAGASARTVRLWKRRARTHGRPVFSLVAPLGAHTSVATIFRATGEPGLRAVKYRGRTWLARQLPNAFAVPSSHGVRSALRRARQHLRRLCAGAPSGIRDGGNAPRYRTGPRRARSSPDPVSSSPLSRTTTYVRAGRGRLNGRWVSLWEPERPC